METKWINLHKVMLENEGSQTQQFAEDVSNAVVVGANANNTAQWVYVNLNTVRFNFIRLGYQYKRWPTDCRSTISKVAILKMTAPLKQPTILYEEDICLNSESYGFCTIPRVKAPDPCRDLTIATCNDPHVNPGLTISKSLPVFYSEEGFFLALLVNIRDFRDRFLIGPIGIEDHTPTITVANPLNFGAVGDGETDDTIALRETIAYGLANHLPIDLGHRTYAFSDILKIVPKAPNDEGFILQNGHFKFTGREGNALEIGKEGNFTPAEIKNIKITGNGQIGLNLTRIAHSRLESITVTGFQVGLQLNGGISNTFSDCLFKDNEINAKIEVYDGTKRCNDNKFWNCRFVGATGYASLYFPNSEAAPGLTAANNAFYACNFEHSNQHAIVIDGAHGTSFIDCRLEGAFVDTQHSHPWIMILLESGRQTRFLNCWVPGSATPERRDSLIHISKLHIGVTIIDCIFSSGQNILNDDDASRNYANWVLPDNF
ncbi:right-handed parallel beta-helix repeat-containing protein [Ulvibacter antarcticus]|uniref:Parallel beta helix pectate lyase-like protein n=1 Tax=Ulvibacter antarcticus TaxID=442714 RepID=A0A3L9YLU7_9FLAO|nr:right-handed parallel beta-helix repeat-containing protein [Ulvibacter antarcticus]RMA58988.1 parallel beta helix pectate lyase-like protein [Ulvibacter antarcticus]